MPSLIKNNAYKYFEGGLPTTSKLYNKTFSYKHIFTNASMQDVLKENPKLQIGMGEFFDGMLIENGKKQFIYFREDFDTFNDIKNYSSTNNPFSFQSFYYDLSENKYIDSLNFYKKEKKIELLKEPVSVNAFLEAVLFSLVHDFELCIPDEIELKRDHSKLFFKVILEELLKHQKVYEAFLIFYDFGFIDDFLPELAELEKVEQDKEVHPEGNALNHVLECLKYFDSQSPLLLWATLLHDIGKTLCNSNDKTRFHKHGSKGMPIARKILERFSFDEEFIEKVCFLVAHHMFPVFIPKMDDTEKMKFIKHPLRKELFQLFKIDIMGSHKDMSFYNRIKNLLFRSSENPKLSRR